MIESLLCKTIGCTSIFAYIPRIGVLPYRVCHWYACRND